MKKIINVCMLICLASFCYANKVATIPGLLKPLSITADENRIYITEQVTVYIYTLQDFKLIKKFGSAGKGPGEFHTLPELPISVNIQTQDLIVNSLGKISYYTKDGKLKKERRTFGRYGYFQPIGKEFVALGIKVKDKTGYRTLNIFDSNLKKKMEIYETRTVSLQSRKIYLLEKSFAFYVYDNKIFISGDNRFNVNVFDKEGNHLYLIKHKYEPLKFTQNDKQEYLDFFKITPPYKQNYEFWRKHSVFPETYPDIFTFFVTNKKIYILTYKKENEKIETYIFDINGKFLRKIFLPIIFRIMENFPFWIENEKIYQLFENEDEEWELHITEIQ